jgi:hypothetical protein
LVAGRLGGLLQTGYERTEEGTFKFRHDGTDNPTMFIAQSRGKRVHPVFQGGHCGSNAICILLPNRLNAPKDLGNGCSRDPRMTCDIVNCRATLCFLL